jgi:hypothetical protein
MSALTDQIADVAITALQCPRRPMAFVLRRSALLEIRREAGTPAAAPEPAMLLDVQLLVVDQQAEPLRVFFSEAELAAHLRT